MPSICLQILWCSLHMTDMCSSIMTYFFPRLSFQFLLALPHLSVMHCGEKAVFECSCLFLPVKKNHLMIYGSLCLFKDFHRYSLSEQGGFLTLRFSFSVTCVFHKDWLLHVSAAVEMVMCGFSLMRLSDNCTNSF